MVNGARGLLERLLQHGLGHRAHGRADRPAGDGADRRQHAAGLGQHLDALVVLLAAQVGRTADADFRRRAVDLQQVGARDAVLEHELPRHRVEAEALGEEIAEIQGQAARDLGPRIAHAVLPIGVKGSSDWQYAWVPITGPVLGAVLASLLYMAIGLK